MLWDLWRMGRRCDEREIRICINNRMEGERRGWFDGGRRRREKQVLEGEGEEGGVNSGRPAINHLFVQSMARDTKVSISKSSNKCAKRFYIRNSENRIRIEKEEESYVLRGIFRDAIDNESRLYRALPWRLFILFLNGFRKELDGDRFGIE